MQRPVVSNVIGVGLLQTSSTIDLQQIAYKMQGSRLNRNKFPGIVIRKTKPKGTILLFKSGKYVVVGASNQQNCQIISKKLVKDLQKILSNPNLLIKYFKISNIIAYGNLGYMVNISRIAQQPNAFKDDKSSGVFLRVDKVKCIIVFESGKVILNGATKFLDIQQAFEFILKQLSKYKLKNQQKVKLLKKQVKQKKEYIKKIANTTNQSLKIQRQQFDDQIYYQNQPQQIKNDDETSDIQQNINQNEIKEETKNVEKNNYQSWKYQQNF